MVTFFLTLAVIVAFAVLVRTFSGPAGSSDVTDRDAQRTHAELAAMLGRTVNH
ncbi:hypothetical protein F5X71_11050 [Nocardia brasiliensis]|uniref:Uncharacterized protein n=1 Tax=Nocardia brasiliensis TaxID=37326 RepID=A0A6G9XPF8_NOCBR|nr:hypothetical protein [Nocardia brasiliensis]QIS02789.1 hypothetical protein F5X71_11050 [Nocardia brasiliensis]